MILDSTPAALVVIGFAVWCLILGKVLQLVESPWELVLSSTRRRRASERAMLYGALGKYLRVRDVLAREELLDRCRAGADPFAVFLRRSLEPDAHGVRETLDLHVREAAEYCAASLRKGSILIPALIQGALVLGLAGAISGLGRSLDSFAHGRLGAAAWAEGAPVILSSSALAAAVAISGWIGWGWVSARSRAAGEEIDLARLRLVERPEGVPEDLGR